MSNPQHRLAVLIDGDNAQSALIPAVFDALQPYGQPVIRRVYRDWSNPHLRSWTDVIGRCALHARQHYPSSSGKNSTDILLIIDAMDLLHEGAVDRFAIVSSDSDYSPLAMRIREGGGYVIGIGRENTSLRLVDACDAFIYTDGLARTEPKPRIPARHRGTAVARVNGAHPRAASPARAHTATPEQDEARYTPIAQTPGGLLYRVNEPPPPTPEAHARFTPFGLPAPVPAAPGSPELQPDAAAGFEPPAQIPPAEGIALEDPAPDVSTPAPGAWRVIAMPKPNPRPGTRQPAPKRARAARDAARTGAAGEQPVPDAFYRLFMRAFAATRRPDGWASLGALSHRMMKLEPGFSPKQYGHAQVIRLLRAYPASFQIRKDAERDGAVFVRPRAGAWRLHGTPGTPPLPRG